MKTRKTYQHQALITEVMTQLHFFKPNPKVLRSPAVLAWSVVTSAGVGSLFCREVHAQRNR